MVHILPNNLVYRVERFDTIATNIYLWNSGLNKSILERALSNRVSNTWLRDFMASEFLGRPFQGPPSVPHASEEFFKVYFLGAHVRFECFVNRGSFSWECLSPVCAEQSIYYGQYIA